MINSIEKYEANPQNIVPRIQNPILVGFISPSSLRIFAQNANVVNKIAAEATNAQIKIFVPA